MESNVQSYWKPWSACKSVWGGIIAIASAALGAAGYTIGPEDAETLSVLLASIGSGIGSLLAIYGRVTAKKAIG